MALFPKRADDAVSCAFAMIDMLESYNAARKARGEEAIAIGIGINSGLLILGTVGNDLRMDGTVISDVVNVASRVEHLTKEFASPLLITEESYRRLKRPELYSLIQIGEIPIRGKEQPIALYAAKR